MFVWKLRNIEKYIKEERELAECDDEKRRCEILSKILNRERREYFFVELLMRILAVGVLFFYLVSFGVMAVGFLLLCLVSFGRIL